MSSHPLRAGKLERSCGAFMLSNLALDTLF